MRKKDGIREQRERRRKIPTFTSTSTNIHMPIWKWRASRQMLVRVCVSARACVCVCVWKFAVNIVERRSKRVYAYIWFRGCGACVSCIFLLLEYWNSSALWPKREENCAFLVVYVSRPVFLLVWEKNRSVRMFCSFRLNEFKKKAHQKFI